MTGPHESDLARLALTPLAADAGRTARTRQRCTAALAGRERRRARGARVRARAARTLAPIIVAACCALYAAALIGNTLRLETVLREPGSFEMK